MSWLRALDEWPTELLGMLMGEPAVARVVLATVRGSAPREPGVAMLVGRTACMGTIGGGQLEWQAIAAARALLEAAGPAARVERLVLAADLGQCCGGVVELWIERYSHADSAFLEEVRAASRDRAARLESTLSDSGLARRVGSNGRPARCRAGRRTACASSSDSAAPKRRSGCSARGMWVRRSCVFFSTCRCR
jgi:xanthine dehydrogenase accessory factor